jgi:predicted esterase
MARLGFVWAVVCAALGASPGAQAGERIDLPGVVVYRANAAEPRPLTVLLHGMCGDAARTCSHFAEAVTKSSHLICPRASLSCAGGGASWPDRDLAEVVESAVARANGELGDAVDDAQGRTLIGYSMGAFRAVGIVQGGSTTRYPRVMLIGAKVALDRARLERSGVERLLLCAGSWDMMHDPMQRETERMRKAGFPARFIDLGPVGHAFTPSLQRYLPEALAWLDSE